MDTSVLIQTILDDLTHLQQSLQPEAELVDMRDVPRLIPAEYGKNVARALREDLPGQTFVVPVPAGKKPLWFAAWLHTALVSQLEGTPGTAEVAAGFDGTITVRLNVEDGLTRPNYPHAAP